MLILEEVHKVRLNYHLIVTIVLGDKVTSASHTQDDPTGFHDW